MVDATVTLYKDIGLSMSYSRTMDFSSKNAQTIWFNSVPANQKLTLTNVNYNKVQNSFYVHEEVGDIYGYSYVRLQDIDNSGRTYYGFISNVELVDEETTRFDITIDPLQTFLGEYEIGESFVVREHIDRWFSNNPTNLKPTGVNIDTVMTKDVQHAIDGDNYKVCVIAISSSAYKQVPESTPLDKIYFAYAIVNIEDPDENVYGIRAYRKVAFSNTAEDPVFTNSTYMDKVKYPSLNQILGGEIFDEFNIPPESIVSISIIPDTGIKTVDSEALEVSFPSFRMQIEVATIKNITVPEYTTSITPRQNTTGRYWIEPGRSEEAYWLDTDPIRGFCNLAPIIGGTISSSTEPTDTVYMLSLLECTANSFSNDEFTLATNLSKPTKPSNGDLAYPAHEPAMYMEPFRQYIITDYKGTQILQIPNYFVVSSSSTDVIKVYTILDVSGVQLFVGYRNYGMSINLHDMASQGIVNQYICDTIPFVNEQWLNYKLTSLDTDRANTMNMIVGNIITGGIYGTYGGALVGSRSASGDRDSKEKRNQLLKRGAIGAAFIGGMSTVGAGLVDGMVAWESQKIKEQAVRNKPSPVVGNSSAISFLNDDYTFKIIELECDKYNYDTAYNNFKYYGYDTRIMEKPNLRSRKYYNYIITQGCNVKGALSAEIKDEIARIFDSGITLFHMDYCTEPDYPTNTDGDEYENIERSLIS